MQNQVKAAKYVEALRISKLLKSFWIFLSPDGCKFIWHWNRHFSVALKELGNDATWHINPYPPPTPPFLITTTEEKREVNAGCPLFLCDTFADDKDWWLLKHQSFCSANCTFASSQSFTKKQLHKKPAYSNQSIFKKPQYKFFFFCL